jgi:hypothetical protein
VPGSDDPRLPKTGSVSFEAWQAAGLDKSSLVADPRFINPGALDFRVRPDSPAVDLGFENFPMDQFGVITPELKKLARQGHRRANGFLHPEILERRNEAAEDARRRADPRSDAVRGFLGARVKNVTTEDEMSAVGIGRIAGVLFVDVPEGSLAAKAGFRTGDCILKVDRTRIDRYRDLVEALKNRRGKPVRIHVDGNPPPRRVNLSVPADFEAI